MQLTLKDGLPFITITITHNSAEIKIPNVLVDTGSAGTIFSVDELAKIGIAPEPQDTLYTIRGVGGIEAVFTRQIDRLQIENRQIYQFEIEVGGMDYGFEINGIVGMDFLTCAGAIINLKSLKIQFTDK